MAWCRHMASLGHNELTWSACCPLHQQDRGLLCHLPAVFRRGDMLDQLVVNMLPETEFGYNAIG